MLEKLKAKKAELEAVVEGYNADIEAAQAVIDGKKADIAKVQEKIAVVDELIAEESFVVPNANHFSTVNSIGISKIEPTNGNGFVL